MRMSNTATEMKKDQMWTKVEKKHYIHVNGSEITYDCNRFMWVVNGYRFKALWQAKEEAETNFLKSLFNN